MLSDLEFADWQARTAADRAAFLAALPNLEIIAAREARLIPLKEEYDRAVRAPLQARLAAVSLKSGKPKRGKEAEHAHISRELRDAHYPVQLGLWRVLLFLRQYIARVKADPWSHVRLDETHDTVEYQIADTLAEARRVAPFNIHAHNFWKAVGEWERQERADEEARRDAWTKVAARAAELRGLMPL
jgi:hypothetical protein